MQRRLHGPPLGMQNNLVQNSKDIAHAEPRLALACSSLVKACARSSSAAYRPCASASAACAAASSGGTSWPSCKCSITRWAVKQCQDTHPFKFFVTVSWAQSPSTVDNDSHRFIARSGKLQSAAAQCPTCVKEMRSTSARASMGRSAGGRLGNPSSSARRALARPASRPRLVAAPAGSRAWSEATSVRASDSSDWVSCKTPASSSSASRRSALRRRARLGRSSSALNNAQRRFHSFSFHMCSLWHIRRPDNLVEFFCRCNHLQFVCQCLNSGCPLLHIRYAALARSEPQAACGSS